MTWSNSEDIASRLYDDFASRGDNKSERDSEPERFLEKMLPSGMSSCGSTASCGSSEGNTGARLKPSPPLLH